MTNSDWIKQVIKEGITVFDNTMKLLKHKDYYGVYTALNNKHISSAIAASAAIANTDTLITNGLYLSQRALTAGSKIKITLWGTCTSSNASAQIFSIRFGKLNTKADGAIATLTVDADAAGTNIPFCIEIDITVRTIDSAGTIYGYGKVTTHGGTGLYAEEVGIIALAGALAMNMNEPGYLNVSYISGHANTATTFQNAIVEVTRSL